MPRDAMETRTALLDAAQMLFMDQGYGGTSVDAILGRTGLTKGAFFHHFESKHELARALIDRYAVLDREGLARSVERAERLSRDPLQQLLILVGLYEEALGDVTTTPPGCLFASYAYQAGLFDDEVHDIVRGSFSHWREVLGAKVQAALDRYPTRLPVDAGEIADALTVVIEGAFIISRTLDEPELVGVQIRHFRNYLELLFGTA
jgi:TetR/AcrR family transcriptional regulator, transcriptional repressor for nem operon